MTITFRTVYFPILGWFFVLSSLAANAQDSLALESVKVTYNKTSTIVFPAVITSVDRGSRDILAQKAKGVKNVLQVKAGRPHFKDTNLTVITGDGEVHHFFIRYADKPDSFLIRIAREPTIPRERPIIFQSDMTDSEMAECAETIVTSPKKIRVKTSGKFEMRLTLQGIYISGNVMFFHLKVHNGSNIPFTTDVLRFFIKDSHNVKRTASQEVSELPLYHLGNDEEFAGKSRTDLVYAIPKFTIPDAKLLGIELMEKNGGRHLQLSIRNRSIIKAKPVALN